MSNVFWAGGWAWWGYVALCAILGAFWSVVGVAWSYTRTAMPWAPHALILAIFWAAMEYAQSFLFSGFGWSAIAYAQATDLWLAQWASVGGVPLIGAIVILVNALIARAWRGPRLRFARLLGAASVALGAHLGGWMLMDAPSFSAPSYNVGLLQADFPLEMKWDAEYSVDMVENAAEKSRRLTEFGEVDLFVWPEALVMEDIETPEIFRAVSTLSIDTAAYLFTGAHRTNALTGKSLNSAYLIDPDGTLLDYYDKIHLAPFGEYVPFSDIVPFIGTIVPAIGEIEHGRDERVFRAAEKTFGPLICFEVVFPAMAERLRQQGADFLIVITNLGWFGTSNAIGQELEIARMRAIETRLPLVHCANTGITGVFDPWGRFTVADVYFADASTAYRVELASRYDTVMHRFGGVFAVADPAQRIWDAGPRMVPNTLLILSIVTVVVGFIVKTIRDRKTA